MSSPWPRTEDRTIDAILLVGGHGTRLRPLTLTTPKPMLPAAGVPFLTHCLARARVAGIDHVVLATSYKPETFEQHFGTGAALGLSIDYVAETEPLGTGGGIRNVAGLLRGGPDDPVVVLNGDILSGHDLAEQISWHVDRQADVTLHLTTVDDARAYGCVPTDDSGRVTAFLEKLPQPVTNQINAGCYVFRRSVIDAIPSGRPVSVERETFPQLLSAGARVLGYVEHAYWRDLGTPEAFRAGCCDLVLGVVPSPAVPETGAALVLAGADVAGSATINGGSAIGAGASVGERARVEASVLLDGAVVGADAAVRRSIVGRDAVIADGVVVEDAVVGDGARVAAGNELRCGARVWPGVTLPPTAVRFSTDA